MPAWALKLGSLLTTLMVLTGAFGYARTHIKNPDAPAASPTPLPSLVGTRRGNPPRPSTSPAPLLSLQPAVQATTLPQVTFTHVS